MSAPLQDHDQQLIAAAQAVIDANTDTTSVDDPGIHTMGAAVRDSAGRIHIGINLAHFTGGPCAELVAREERSRVTARIEAGAPVSLFDAVPAGVGAGSWSAR